MKNAELAIVIEAAKNNSNEAFAEIIRRFRGSVYNAALKNTRCPLTAEEVTQDTFIKVWQGIGSVEDNEKFPGFVRTIANRTLISFNRKRKEEIASEEALQSVACRESEEIDTTEADEVREGIAKLDGFDRETLEAYYLNGKKIKTIAAETNTPVGTIKRRLTVARRRLKAQLQFAAA